MFLSATIFILLASAPGAEAAEREEIYVNLRKDTQGQTIYAKTVKGDRPWSGKAFVLDFGINTTVQDVKATIHANQPELPPKQQRLIFAGQIMEDGHKLSDYHVQKDCTIHLVHIPESIKIFVKALTGKTEVLDVKPSDTVRSVKDKLFENSGAPSHRQRLILPPSSGGGSCATILEDDRTLQEYSIKDQSTLHMVILTEPSYYTSMQIYVRPGLNDDVEPVCLDVEPSDTIANVKAMFQKRTGLHPDQQLYVFAGKFLNNESTLAECNIVQGSYIHYAINCGASNCGRSAAEQEAPAECPNRCLSFLGAQSTCRAARSPACELPGFAEFDGYCLTCFKSRQTSLATMD